MDLAAAVNRMAMDAEKAEDAAAAGGLGGLCGGEGGAAVAGQDAMPLGLLPRVRWPCRYPACFASCARPPRADGGSGDEMDEDGEEGGGGGKEGGGGGARRRRGRASEGFKEQVLEVLQRHGFLERRGAKMSQDDFLQLLAAFNAVGIHFAS